ncbi:LysR substrate-binding domain-containing protein [Pectobacterium carotovorum]|uniref:LysR substrate-binding domain-containing protein n=1 Tax=Pectobacterium carotovorum TaxID=554 RepID=UPI0010FD3230|nr:LysR substrate-binding domain-containing protein [Pectobacterium carotovorum]KAA3667995.1 LysR family transcriptional regulator [Pectobacterium carotovorum subsp. carotovorum]UCZ77953.1 LysR family transcriptional regulator [Pectobacterium carotovorum]
MEIVDLKTLIALVEQGGITQAAKTLNRVPSAITTRLQQLESTLGVALFLREKKRFILTQEGRSLYDYARRIIDLVDEAENHVRHSVPGGKFRLGALDSMAATRLPAPLARLHAQNPTLELELSTGISKWLYDALLDNRLDAAFLADAPQDDRLERLSIFEEELFIIAPAGQKAIHTPDDIRNSTVLAFSDGCSYRDRLLNWYLAHQRKPQRIVEMTSYHAILSGVAAGMGVGIVPAVLLTLFPDRSLIGTHAISGSESRIVTELLWRKGMRSANLSALLACLEK